MKRVCRILLLLVTMAALLTCAAFAEETTVGDVTFIYIYDEVENEILITDITLAETVVEPIDVEIPASIEEAPVTELDLQQLSTEAAAKIKTLTFAGNVPTIFGNLFRWQYQKTGLDIEQSNWSYFYDAVPDTETLLSSIPDFVTGNYNYDSNGDGTNDTYYAGENLVRVDADYEGDLTVKDGTVSILASAMEGCSGLGNVTLPDSVEWIGVRAFANSGVTSVNLPTGLLTAGSKMIQMQTFFGCTNLQTVTFPAGTDKLTRVGWLAFYNCSSLTGFDFTRVAALDTLSFAKAFAEGTAIDLSQTVIASGAAPFSHSGVGSVTFGAATGGNIPFEAFYKCDSLTGIKGMAAVQNICAWAFSDCTSLTQDVLKDCTEKSLSLGSAYRAFANTGMTEITIPSTVTSITGGTFAGNEQLETLNWCTPTTSSPLFALLNDCNKGYSYYCWSQYAMPGETVAEEYTFPKTLNIYTYPNGGNSSLFYNQPYLEAVNVRCEITKIYDNAFQFCPNLKEITFQYPEKITSIGFHAFGGCLSLKSFPFADMTELTSIAGNAFMLIKHSEADYGWYTPESYNKLPDAQKAYGLEEIDLSACTKLGSNIGQGAFYNQYSVTSLHLPIGCSPSTTGIFHGTVSMRELICDGDLTNNLIAKNMMTSTAGYNDNLETVTVKGQLVYMGYPLFFGMDALKTVNLPEATSIPQTCFHSCTGLETVSAPKVTTMGKDSFFGTENLKSISLPELTAIPVDGFLGCSGLETVDLPKVTTMGKNSFYGLTNLKSISLPELSAISEDGFLGCSGLETVDLPKVTTMGRNAFFGLSNLKSVSLPEATAIPEQCFLNCTSLESVTAPKAEAVENCAFLNSGLKEIAISGDVTYGDYVFMNSKLEKVVVEEGVTELGDFMFEGCTALKQVSLPSTLETINWAAFKKAAATTIDIPASVTLIEDDAFCSGSFKLIFRGSPIMELVHKTSSGGMNNLLPINSDATIYYANDDARQAAENYTASLSEEFTAPAMEALPAKLELVITGAPATVTAGEQLDLTGLKVTYNGTVLTADQYQLDYDRTDKTPGLRTVTLSVTDASIFEPGCLETTISAGALTGKNVSGKTYSVVSELSELIGTFTVDVTVPDPVHFEDVPAGAYYADAIQWATDEGIARGTSEATFSPNSGCTRAQAVVFLWRAAGCPAPESAQQRFADVPVGSYYYDAVLWATEQGITSGTSAATFSPNKVCTRAQAVCFLHRFAGSPTAEKASTFADVKGSAFYAGAVNWAVEKGITYGTTATTFSPNTNCTRSQFMTFLFRYLGA